MIQLSHPYMTTGKTIALTIQTFVGKVMSLLFNTVFRIVIRASLVPQTVKCLLAMQDTWVQSLGWEDSLEKEMAAHSNILARGIPWTEEPGGPKSRTRHSN